MEDRPQHPDLIDLCPMSTSRQQVTPPNFIG